MNSEFENLDLIDLLSERHHQLRSLCEELWNKNHDFYISNSEWFIMARVYKKQPTISYVTKHVDISRQATHKFIKSLESKGLVEISQSQHSNRDKCLRLTELGETCFEENERIKATLEKKITDTIGAEKVELLRNLLKSDWGL